MCGIAGLVGDFVPGLMERMNSVQGHRGPDGHGVFERPESQVALGHTRLAVLDLSDHAAQPMISADGRYALVYNGEIYNFNELRESLAESGPARTSSGDTEVLLHGLMRWGDRFIERLNGMFAFALWDGRERELVLVRDPLGIKPVYYAAPTADSLLFASEIKALCAHPRVERRPDWATIEQHLTFCHSCSDRTAFAGIRRLEPGTLLRWSARTRCVTTTQYWRPRFSVPESSSRESPVERVRAAVEAATRRQLVSDVPVGSFLSGGLDSSLITAIAARHTSGREPFRSYTISYPGQSNQLDQMHDDAPYARRLAASLGLEFHEISIGPEVAELLPRVIYHLDEPIADPAAIACFLISKRAREDGTKVLLSGQGADELFGGYPRYAAMRRLSWVDRLPVALRAGVASSAGLLPGGYGGPAGATLRRARRVLREIHQPAEERFLAYCMSTPPDVARAVLNPDIRDSLKESRPQDDCRWRMQTGGLSGEDRFLERDLAVYLPNHNLLYTDKMGMAVGVETRVPLLDLELVEAANHLSPAQRLWPMPKAILRKAARGLIPDAIIDRPKAGFGAPYRHWLRHDLDPLWNDVMDRASLRRRGWFSFEAVQKIRQQSQAGRADYYMLQWALLTVELWARQFLDRHPASAWGADRAQTPPDRRTSLCAA